MDLVHRAPVDHDHGELIYFVRNRPLLKDVRDWEVGSTAITAQLSLTMIVRDGESTVGRVLGQAATFCDEIIVADTGSRDRTPEIAREAGARVLDFAWIDDFSAARNASLDACRGDWVMWLDADDVVTSDVQEEILTVKREILTDDLDVITALYRISFEAKTGECTFSFRRERLARRVPGLRWVPAYLQDPGAKWEQYTALIGMSECSGRLGKPEEAAEHLHTAVRLDPSRAAAFLRLGCQYFKRPLPDRRASHQ